MTTTRLTHEERELTDPVLLCGADGRLARGRIEAGVMDPCTLVPLDKEMILASVRKTGRLVVVEEDNRTQQ